MVGLLLSPGKKEDAAHGVQVISLRFATAGLPNLRVFDGGGIPLEPRFCSNKASSSGHGHDSANVQ